MSFSFTQRAAKLATRAGKGVLDWGKDKVKTVTRAVGSFFENLLKLLALLGLFLALSWLKGKDLKKMFDAFMKKVKQIMDEWIPQWIKDLSFGEAMSGAVGTLIACLMATYPVNSIFFFFQEILGLFGSAMAGIFILGIFIKKAHWKGTLTGAIISILTLIFVKYNTSLNFYIYPLIGIPTCVVIGYIFSYIIPFKEKYIDDLVY